MKEITSEMLESYALLVKNKKFLTLEAKKLWNSSELISSKYENYLDIAQELYGYCVEQISKGWVYSPEKGAETTWLGVMTSSAVSRLLGHYSRRNLKTVSQVDGNDEDEVSYDPLDIHAYTNWLTNKDNVDFNSMLLRFLDEIDKAGLTQVEKLALIGIVNGDSKVKVGNNLGLNRSQLETAITRATKKLTKYNNKEK